MSWIAGTGPQPYPLSSTARVFVYPGTSGTYGITSFWVYYNATGQAGAWLSCAYTGMIPTPCDVAGLTAGEQWNFSAGATSAAGTGSFSPTTTTSAPDVPGTPTTPVLSRDGSGSLYVSVSAPSNGTPITWWDYVYESAYEWGSGRLNTSFRLNNLTNGELYRVKVRASSVVGDGPWSAWSSELRPCDVPTNPSGLAVNWGSTNSSLDVSWNAPTSGNGCGVDSYRVYYSTSSAVSQASPYVTTTSTSTTLTGLTTKATYYVLVAAVNNAGVGPTNGTVKSQTVFGPTLNSPGNPTLSFTLGTGTTTTRTLNFSMSWGANNQATEYNVTLVGPNWTTICTRTPTGTSASCSASRPKGSSQSFFFMITSSNPRVTSTSVNSNVVTYTGG